MLGDLHHPFPWISYKLFALAIFCVLKWFCANSWELVPILHTVNEILILRIVLKWWNYDQISSKFFTRHYSSADVCTWQDHQNQNDSKKKTNLPKFSIISSWLLCEMDPRNHILCQQLYFRSLSSGVCTVITALFIRGNCNHPWNNTVQSAIVNTVLITPHHTVYTITWIKMWPNWNSRLENHRIVTPPLGNHLSG